MWVAIPGPAPTSIAIMSGVLVGMSRTWMDVSLTPLTPYFRRLIAISSAFISTAWLITQNHWFEVTGQRTVVEVLCVQVFSWDPARIGSTLHS